MDTGGFMTKLVIIQHNLGSIIFLNKVMLCSKLIVLTNYIKDILCDVHIAYMPIVLLFSKASYFLLEV